MKDVFYTFKNRVKFHIIEKLISGEAGPVHMSEKRTAASPLIQISRMFRLHFYL